MTQQKPHRPRGARGELQAAGRGHVERTRIAPDFRHHNARHMAAQALFHGPERGFGVFHRNQQEPRGVQAERLQPRPIGQARFLTAQPILNPEKAPRFRPQGPCRNGKRKAGKRRCMNMGGAGPVLCGIERTVHFMKRAARKPTRRKTGIKRRYPGCDWRAHGALRRLGPGLPTDFGDPRFKRRQKRTAWGACGAGSFSAPFSMLDLLHLSHCAIASLAVPSGTMCWPAPKGTAPL